MKYLTLPEKALSGEHPYLISASCKLLG